MDKLDIAVGLAALGLLGLLGSAGWTWWKRRRTPTANAEITFGSDDQPPQGFMEFASAIRDAAGTSTSAEFKLYLICSGFTIAEALKQARLDCEKRLTAKPSAESQP